MAEPFSVRLRFDGDLGFFLKSGTNPEEVRRELKEPTSVKDVIESCGVPHTEVGQISVEDLPVDFNFVLRKNADLIVYPVGFRNEEGESIHFLQRRSANRFVADGHLGKLARNLRFLGFDVAYINQIDDSQLLQIMETEKRTLLTRDRRLLMHAVVHDGYCPRSSDPMEQTVEVVRRFRLGGELKPFTRCLDCNSFLAPIDKAAVLEQLEPLTRIYYNEFRQCTGCGKIFWRGSHFSNLEGFLQRLRAELTEG